MTKVFSYCSSLTSIDLSNFNSENNRFGVITGLFFYCTKLKYVDISNYYSYYSQSFPIFENFPAHGKIIMNLKMLNKITKIPDNWEIILAD